MWLLYSQPRKVPWVSQYWQWAWFFLSSSSTYYFKRQHAADQKGWSRCVLSNKPGWFLLEPPAVTDFKDVHLMKQRTRWTRVSQGALYTQQAQQTGLCCSTFLLCSVGLSPQGFLQLFILGFLKHFYIYLECNSQYKGVITTGGMFSVVLLSIINTREDLGQLRKTMLV